MNACELAEWVERHEAAGHEVGPADNPKDRTHGAFCGTCNEWAEGDGELTPELKASRERYRQKIKQRLAEHPERSPPAVWDDDFSMTANYFHD